MIASSPHTTPFLHDWSAPTNHARYLATHPDDQVSQTFVIVFSATSYTPPTIVGACHPTVVGDRADGSTVYAQAVRLTKDYTNWGSVDCLLNQRGQFTDFTPLWAQEFGPIGRHHALHVF